MKKFLYNKIGGFTLIEAMVAISIFTVSILALVAVLSDDLADINYAKQKVIAAYLAQEGVEYMRNIRDTLSLYQTYEANGWDQFQIKTLPCDSTYGCYFDDTGLNFEDQSKPIIDIDVNACTGDCPEMALVEEEGRYNYDPLGEPSGFTRTIFRETINGNESKFISVVRWEFGSQEYEVSMSDYFYNWMQQ